MRRAETKQVSRRLAVAIAIVAFLSITSGSVGQDCNDNGIPDPCDIACGDPGGPCDLPGCGESADCNGNGIPDECDIANQGAGFDDPAAWDTYEYALSCIPAETCTNPRGYAGAAFDGRYVYFAPLLRGNDEVHGEVLRYDTRGGLSDPSSWTAFDPGENGVGTDPDGYYGAVFDPVHGHVYFAPLENGSEYHGEVLRYNTAEPFGDASSWDTFDAKEAIGAKGGYVGAGFDGAHIYFVPHIASPGTMHGEVLRYNTNEDFFTASSWEKYEYGTDCVPAEACEDPRGYAGEAAFDGRFVYFAPSHNGSEFHSEVLRYDTTGAFDDAASWKTYDPGVNGLGPDVEGYFGAVFANGFVYFVPSENTSEGYNHGKVLRYDVSGPFDELSSWSIFDARTSTGARGGYRKGVFDGRFVYFIPFEDNNGPHGEVLRYDTSGDFFAVSSWEKYDYGADPMGCGQDPDCTDPDKYLGAAFDGRYVYFAPYDNGSMYHGEVLRYDTTAGWSLDCDANGVPDECEPDCDGDGVIDDCDDDDDNDGVLDSEDVLCPRTPGCEVMPDGRPRLDLNGDCEVNGQDIPIIVQQILDGCSVCE